MQVVISGEVPRKPDSGEVEEVDQKSLGGQIGSDFEHFGGVEPAGNDNDIRNGRDFSGFEEGQVDVLVGEFVSHELPLERKASFGEEAQEELVFQLSLYVYAVFSISFDFHGNYYRNGIF